MVRIPKEFSIRQLVIAVIPVIKRLRLRIRTEEVLLSTSPKCY